MASNHERSFKSAARFFSRSPAGSSASPPPSHQAGRYYRGGTAHCHRSGLSDPGRSPNSQQRPRVVAQIVTHLPGQVALAHGRFHRPKVCIRPPDSAPGRRSRNPAAPAVPRTADRKTAGENAGYSARAYKGITSVSCMVFFSMWYFIGILPC